MQDAIPREIFTFWDGASMPELVRGCIELMRTNNPSFSVHVLSSKNLDAFGLGNLTRVPNFSELEGAHLGDAVRLEALARYGGVWLDASIITTQPVEAWVNMSVPAMHGFATPWSTL
eukprot:1854684-Prymnesium_polylepis.1